MKANTKEKEEGRQQNELGAEIVDNIIDNYVQLEESIVKQLSLFIKQHPGTTGTLREDIWQQLFERIVPKKFVIEHSIFIIDSEKRLSKEVDLAIIDNSYTPYIFQYGRLKYVPIEAVAAVIECKSRSLTWQEKRDAAGNLVEEGMAAWRSAIENLQTSRESIARMAAGTVIFGTTTSAGRERKTSTQTSTRPIRIFCGYETKMSSEIRGKMEEFFDFILIAQEENGRGKIHVQTKCRDSLQEWYFELDHYKNKMSDDAIKNAQLNNDAYGLDKLRVERDGRDISLLSFNFQLNQLLMLINNPILFPHFAYAEMFGGNRQKPQDEGNI